MISVCPRCDGKVRLPDNVDRDSRCVCPLCHANYALAELEDHDVPSVVLVSHGTEPFAGNIPHAPSNDLTDNEGVPSKAADRITDTASEAIGLGDTVTDDQKGIGDGMEDPVELVSDFASDSEGAVKSSLTEKIDYATEEVSDRRSDFADVTDDVGVDDGLLAKQLDASADDEFDLDFDESGDDLVFEIIDEDASPRTSDQITHAVANHDDVPPEATSLDAKPASLEDSATGASVGENEKTASEDGAKTVPIEVVKPFDFKPPPGHEAKATRRDFRPRLPGRRRTIIAEVLKFTVGGVLGLSIAQGILWWLPKIDPLKMAPRLPTALAFLAPSELRASAAPSQPTGPMEEATEREADGANAAVPDDGTDTGADEATAQNSDADLPSALNTDGHLANDSQSRENADNGDAPWTEAVEPVVDNIAAQPTIPTDDTGFAPLPFDEPRGDNDESPPNGAELVTVGPRNIPTVTRDELRRSLEDARQLDGQLAAAPREQLLSIARQYFVSCCDMAEKVAFASEEDSSLLLPEVHDLLLNAKTNPTGLGYFATEHLNSHSSGGICLAGVLQSVSASGDLFRIQIELLGIHAKPHPVVSVISAIDPTTNLASPIKVGDNALVLGFLCQDPDSEIAGYAGPNELVVWAGEIAPIKAK